ncbi:MAG: DUF11 domain-containing protein, partial [Chloroflexi bacterium]
MSRPDYLNRHPQKLLPKSQSRVVFAKITAPVILASILLALLFTIMDTPATTAAGLSITKSASAGSVSAGDPFTYILTATNSTGGDLLVVISDTVPAGMEVTDTGGGTLNNGIITWSSLPLPNLSTVQVQFTGRVTRAGTVENTTYGVTNYALSAAGAPVSTLIVPNTPTQVIVEAAPGTVPVGPASTVALTVTVADQYGNPAVDATTVSLDFNLGSIDGQPAGSTVTGTTAGGQLTKVWATGTVAGTGRITATAAGVTDGVASVTLTPGPANDVQVSALPTTISTVGGQKSTVTAVVQDQYGNPLNGIPITFTTSLGILNGGGSMLTAV